MQTKDSLDHLDKQKRDELRRFFMVGATAVAIQYGTYLLLIEWLPPTVANTIAYGVSLLFNYIASTRFTFRVKPTAKRGAGFALAHLVNYLLQTILLAFFLWLDWGKGISMLPVFAICVPVNFILVRYFLKR